MLLNRTTAFLGTNFGGLKKAGVRALLSDALWDVDFKPQWKLAKNTECAVLGTDASDQEREAIAERGLPSLDFRAWLGWEEASGAQTAHAYLQALVDQGYRFSESTTEGDLGEPEVVNIPLVDDRDVVFEWVDKTFGEWLGSSQCLDEAPVNGFTGLQGEHRTIWKHSWSYGIDASQGRLRAVREDRILPGIVLARYLDEFGTRIAPAFFGGPNHTAHLRVYVAGAIEGGGRSVSFVALPVVNT
jgi:hypothetical protein